MTRKTKSIFRLLTAGFGLLVLAGIGGGIYAQAQEVEPSSVSVTGIDCPTEDSCTIDYRDGHWVITQVTP